MMKCSEIVPGGVYLYTSDHPSGCKGHEYRVFKIINQEPSKARQVIVECLTGPDQGHWFCCTPNNFAHRYEPKPEPAQGNQA